MVTQHKLKALAGLGGVTLESLVGKVADGRAEGWDTAGYPRVFVAVGGLRGPLSTRSILTLLLYGL